MVKNEIHARLSPEVMNRARELTEAKNFPTLSHTIRWLLAIAFNQLNEKAKTERLNTSVLQLIEQECGVSFSRCRDEYDPEDGQLYWFWFETEAESSREFDVDSLNNWCPTKRFKSQEEAVRDWLRSRLNPVSDAIAIGTADETIPSPTSETLVELETIIDW